MARNLDYEQIIKFCERHEGLLQVDRLEDFLIEAAEYMPSYCSDMAYFLMHELHVDLVPFLKKTVPEGTFAGNSEISNISLLDSVSTIGAEAFSNSTLTNIKLSKNLKAINEYAFFACKNLTTIEIPEGVIELPEGSFQNCTNLKTVLLPESIEKIEPSAFKNTHKDLKVLFASPESVGKINFVTDEHQLFYAGPKNGGQGHGGLR